MDQDKRYFAGWWFWLLGLIIVGSIAMWALHAAGIIGTTVVEREVFERSFQYSEARKAEIATYEAQLAEIEEKLASTTISQETRDDLEAQRSAIRIRLRVAKQRSER